MSLNLILPPDGVQDLTSTWPDEPRVYQREPGDLEQAITAGTLHDHIETICDPRFRRILRPAEVTGRGLAAQIGETRDALVKHLTNLDPDFIAGSVREAALTDLEYAT